MCFVILVSGLRLKRISERIETEIKMDQRHRVVVFAQMKIEIGWCEHEISANEISEHKIESDTSTHKT